ncbi:S-layer homology domain-containing protein [Butyricicoccus sp. AM05-1]|uniref:S-layer homology domain-containing protein n=1 Tax=Butyricicoccus sp. AM05-1 TaxID=2292004 RepID=UPI0011C22982|nr:S-layer homology domain-containing protein [Butyricicoccus sp. AM05-1]
MAAGVGAVSDKPNADDTQLGDWARSSVYAMREIGIMPGKENNRFRPKDGYTQEQAVVTVERAVSGCESILKLFFLLIFRYIFRHKYPVYGCMQRFCFCEIVACTVYFPAFSGV